MPETPISDSAARTSSSLKGLMIAVTSFMCELSVGFPMRYLYKGWFRGFRGRREFAAFMPRSESGVTG
jgi:hypothetical protein